MNTIRLIIITALAAMVQGAWATEPDGKWSDYRDTSWGSDYSATTFTISTPEQLAQLAYMVNDDKNFKGKTIYLAADISLKGHYWIPIGCYAPFFLGTFDGKGYSISNVYVKEHTYSWSGLFGQLGESGSDNIENGPGYVKNLTVSNSTINGYESGVEMSNATGAIAGFIAYGSVSNCVVESTVNVFSGSICCGGLVGRLLSGDSTVEGCVCAAKVRGTSNVGGLVGENCYGNVRSCLYTGNSVTSTTDAGTVAAMIGNIVIADNTYPISYYVRNTYFTDGSMSGKNGKDVYAKEVTFTSDDGITVGFGSATPYDHSGITQYYMGDSYSSYYSMAYGDKHYAGSTMVFTTNVIPGYEIASVTVSGTEASYYTYSTYYTLDPGTSGCTVTLKKQLAAWSGTGSGTESAPYEVKTTDDMLWIAAHVNASSGYDTFSGKYFKLMNDISFTGTGYKPIGTSATNCFSGTFDGNGYAISGIYINTTAGQQALFGHVKDATIKNLTLDNSTITVTDHDGVGGIVAFAASTVDNTHKTTIENCHVTSSVTLVGRYHVGGILAETFSGNTDILGCTSAAKVTAVQYAGGIAGRLGVSSTSSNSHNTTISHCLYYGSSLSSTNAGAIAGECNTTNHSGVDFTHNYYYYTDASLKAIGKHTYNTITGGISDYSVIDILENDGAVRACVITSAGDKADMGANGDAVASYEGGITIYANGAKLGNGDNAVYYSHVLTLPDNADNSGIISLYAGMTFNVKLSRRTLYKDGNWNTLCLPFPLALGEAPLEGATVMQLADTGKIDSQSYDTGCNGDSKLYLFFENAPSIAAAKPYIIKWEKASGYDYNDPAFNLSDPVFLNVTISADKPDEKKYVSKKDGGKLNFIGLYKPSKEYDKENLSVLYLGANNMLYYPAGGEPVSIGAFRAYFKLDGIEVKPKDDEGGNTGGGGDARVFIVDLDYGEDSAIHAQALNPSEGNLQDWYDLSGRRLVTKPTTKGIYLHKGKKVSVW